MDQTDVPEGDHCRVWIVGPFGRLEPDLEDSGCFRHAVLAHGDVACAGVDAGDDAVVPERREESGGLVQEHTALVAGWGGEPAERQAEQTVVAGDPRVLAGLLGVSALTVQVVVEHPDGDRERAESLADSGVVAGLGEERERRSEPVAGRLPLPAPAELVCVMESRPGTVGGRRVLASRLQRRVQPFQPLAIRARPPVSAELAGEPQSGLRSGIKRPLQSTTQVVDLGVEDRERLPLDAWTAG